MIGPLLRRDGGDFADQRIEFLQTRGEQSGRDNSTSNRAVGTGLALKQAYLQAL